MKNYVFFIGGSGARSYMAFLHCCAAGFMRTEEIVEVLLVDEDSTNAACLESCALYESYKWQHKALSAEYKKLKEGGASGASAAFCCDVRMPRVAAIAPTIQSSPTHSSVLNLEKLFGGDKNEERALKWFYTEDERRQDLSRGFYAHPNIGCLFFQSIADLDLAKSIDNIQQELEEGRDVRVVLVGSVFGGTGAAGISSLLKIIDERCRGMTQKPHFCGVLITPYFKVPEAPQNSKNLQINSDDFYSNTKAALKYYHSDGRFESIYLVGQKELETVNPNYADGGEGQNNKAHIVEVFAAMAIKDFLTGSPSPGIRGRIIRADEIISWESLDADLDCMADMLRAQTILKTEIYPYVDRKNDYSSYNVHQWYRVFNMSDAVNQGAMKRTRRYSDMFFQWMAPIQSTYVGSSLTKDVRIQLFGPLVAEITAVPSTGEHLFPATSYGRKQLQSKFDSLIDATSHISYLLQLITMILSLLGGPPKLTPLGWAGCLIRLLELVSEKKT